MKHTKTNGWLAGIAALAMGAAGVVPLSAQQPSQSGQPGRAVRLSYVDGQVRLSQGNQVLADPAVINTPMFEGMQLTTGDSGKAEIQFEDGSVARLSPDSSMTLAALRGQGSAGDAEIQVNAGLAYFELQGGNQTGQMRVLFGNSAVTASGFTVLRVDMDNPPGAMAVFSGNAHLDSNGGAQSVDLHGGESIALNGANPSAYQVAESIEPDSWDAWNSDRDQALTTEAASQTGASADLGQSQNPAWSDLDANGNWYNVPGQGYVWSPYDASDPGFDPYGNGNWMWTPGYGYIWTSGYSWGYMPFTCGAWNFYNGFGWGWAPGMGGCMPWWGMGFYGGPNIGYAPPSYPRIVRPGQPRRPFGPHPVPLVAVNRRSTFVNGALPLRQRNTAVTIGGARVDPMRTIPSHPVYAHTAPVYSHSSTVTTSRGYMSTPGQQNSGGKPPETGTRPGYGFAHPSNGGQNSGTPNPGNNSNPNANKPSNEEHHGFWGGFGNHPSNGNNSGAAQGNNGGQQHNGGNPGGSSPRPSGGNPGGGSPHPSGGGGGMSGGGAPHSSGGGGGGGSHSSGSGGGSGHH